jgi:hypothetical protein
LTAGKESKFSGRFMVGQQKKYKVKSQLKAPEHERYLKFGGKCTWKKEVFQDFLPFLFSGKCSLEITQIFYSSQHGTLLMEMKPEFDLLIANHLQFNTNAGLSYWNGNLPRS